VAPESRTQGPVCVVCATKAMEPEFQWSSYHLKNSLKAPEEAIDKVRETTLKDGEKNPKKKKSNELQSGRAAMDNNRVGQ